MLLSRNDIRLYSFIFNPVLVSKLHVLCLLAECVKLVEPIYTQYIILLVYAIISICFARQDKVPC